VRTRQWGILLLTVVTALASRPALAHPGHMPGLDTLLSQDLSPALVMTSLGLAAVFGAGHAFSPGHGKTMVAAYLVGSHSTPKHALLLGAVTTITHTFSVFVLGFITLLLSHYILPEQLYPFLSLSSGLTVTGVGVWLFLRVKHRRSPQADRSLPSSVYHAEQSLEPALSSVDPEHHHPSTHHPTHGVHAHSFRNHGHHHPALPPKITLKSLVALGMAGGIIPCPSALILLLSAIALQQTALGLLLVSSFSLGLAIVLSTLGLAAVYARRWLEQLPPLPFLQTLRHRLPMLSAFITLWAGLLLTANTLLEWP
jgi:nickel/cobalt transporter (NicO) family protein